MLEDKAKDLGRTIGQSEEYKSVKRSSEALNGDREASTVLRQMETIRSDAQALIDGGEEPTPEMEQQLDALLQQVQTNPSYQRAIVAQENFDKLMLRVNGWIADGIRAGATSSIILG
ncbi:MAG: YlbF family regulator [Gemmatimonas sp.]